MSFSPRIDAIEQSVRSLAPNLIINGAMDFWQRSNAALTVNTSEAYLNVDRFKLRASGSGATYTASQSTDVPSAAFKYSLSMSDPDAISDAMLASQRIEAATIRQYVGRTMTFSLWVKNETFSAAPSLNFYVPISGTEDGWASDLILQDTLVQSTSIASPPLGAWTRISTTITIPASAANGLAAYLITASVTGAPSYKTTGWMLTEGNQAPSYFYRNGVNLQSELAACQRYYQKLATADTYTVAYGHRQNATVYRVSVPLIVPMRATPVFSESNIADFRLDSSADDTLTPTAVSQSDITDLRLSHLNVTVATTTGRVAAFRSELASTLTWNAEL